VYSVVFCVKRALIFAQKEKMKTLQITQTTKTMSSSSSSSLSSLTRRLSPRRGRQSVVVVDTFNDTKNKNAKNRLLRSRQSSNELRLRANADGASSSSSSSSSEGSGVAFERLVEPLIKTKKDDDTLNEGIAAFYDQSTPLWEEIWGDHLHHGYYPNGSAEGVDHQAAQVDMIDRALDWASISNKKNILDVGCGLGGSSRYFARKWGKDVKATGVTLSPVQVARGNRLGEEQGLDEQVNLQVADALNMPFEDGKFDFVYSMESGEHMPDKKKFVGELARVCAPNGRILIVTWCHRNLKENETELNEDEQKLLKRICDAYYLPAWCSSDDYVKLMKAEGLKDIRTEDWSLEVRPFWRAVIKTALTWRGILGLFKSGPETLRGALVMPLMTKGLKDGTIAFNLLTCVKE
jgi:tocopherol O-methyltransferase